MGVGLLYGCLVNYHVSHPPTIVYINQANIFFVQVKQSLSYITHVDCEPSRGYRTNCNRMRIGSFLSKQARAR